MPKSKVKEEKPRKRLGKKELLIPPVAMGISLLINPGCYSSPYHLSCLLLLQPFGLA